MTSAGRRRLWTALAAAGILAILAAAASPWIVSTYWRYRSDNTVRRGFARAHELGCFSCHGPSGSRGIPVPGRDQGVPDWTGGVWMMYVQSDEDVRKIIRDGSDGDGHDDHDADGDHDHASDGDGGPGISMPAYGDLLGPAELDDLVATFQVLSGMVKPPSGSDARTGFELARTWDCFSCHGPAGSGGLPNPGSFTGFVPGWYGADFDDLVRDRDEFDSWVRDGEIPRLANHPIASYFLSRQQLQMPAYSDLTPDELDALWAYVGWLAETDGGHEGEIAGW